MSVGVAHKNDFCRCCLVADGDLYYMKNLQFTHNGVQVQLLDTFWECSGLIQKTAFGVFDAEPKICLNCKLQLESVHNFRALCRKTDNALQTIYALDSETTLDGSFLPHPSDDIKTEAVEEDFQNNTDYSCADVKLELTEQPASIYQTELPCTSFFQHVQPNSYSHIHQVASTTTLSNIQQSQSTPITKTQVARQVNKKMPCDRCGVVSNNQTESINHDKTECIFRPIEFFDDQLQRRKYQCKKCCKTYASNISFQQHIKTDHQNIRFNCTICAKVFKSRLGMRSHMVNHTQIYPYVCPVEDCKYKGSQNFAFKTHLKNHHNIQ